MYFSKSNFPVYHRCFAAIDLDAIGYNLSQLQAGIREGVKTLAIVKADAYGHGSVPVACFLEDKIDYFAVSCIEEAISLRENGIRKPILILSYIAPSQYGQLLEYDVTTAIYNLEEAKLLSGLAVSRGTRARVHVAVDTGMGRIGVTPDVDGVRIVQEMSCLKGLDLEGLFSHYACADCADKEESLEQTRLFDRFIELLAERGLEIPIKHICNSAAIMQFEKQYDMCRLGIALYGLYPSDEVDREQVKLVPAMKVVSNVIHVKTVPAGFKIGYGHAYEAPSERRIATVSIGYADGFNRCLTGTGYVLIRGKKAPVVGRVCMDQIMVDVTDIPDACLGDWAVVLGRDQDAEITAEEFGAMSHSFNYEVICNFMPRVTRVYHKSGTILEV